MLTGLQIRAARNAIRWSANDLALKSGIALKTIQRIEANDGVPQSYTSTLNEIRSALESAGIEFTGTPEDGPGIRIRPVPSKGAI